MSSNITIKGVFDALPTEGGKFVYAVVGENKEAIVPSDMKHPYEPGDIINCTAVRRPNGLVEVTSFSSAIGFNASPER